MKPDEIGIGVWAGCRVAVIGDYIEADALGVPTATGEDEDRNLWTLSDEAYRDISSAVAVMLLEHDGPDELVERARIDPRLFVMLGELALVYRHPACIRLMENAFPNWQKKYAKEIASGGATTVNQTSR